MWQSMRAREKESNRETERVSKPAAGQRPWLGGVEAVSKQARGSPHSSEWVVLSIGS